MYRQKNIVTYMRERAKRASASFFRSQNKSAYIHNYNQCSNPFNYLWHGAINDHRKTKHYNIEGENVLICERAERASLDRIFNILKLLFPLIFCWYTSVILSQKHVYSAGIKLHLHACRLTCTDKFPNVPTKLRAGIIGGGGAIAPLATLVFRKNK